MIDSCRARILENEALRGGFYILKLDAPPIAGHCDPGQFIMLRGLGPEWPYLRRPFSIYSSDGESEIEIVYKDVGRATSLMARTGEGEYDVLGPLGKAFDVPAQGTHALAVAGGSGVPPVAFYCRRYMDLLDGASLIVGARKAEDLLLPVGLVAGGVEVRSYTEDGSKGTRGTALDGLIKALGQARSAPAAGQTSGKAADGSIADGSVAEGDMAAGKAAGPPRASGLRVIACGPRDLLARVAVTCAAAGIPCQVSVEEVMACGLGACLACAVPRKCGGYFHACKDGPVFEAGEIDWERWLA
jgi:dihydroorotate dehydrogenase electron transfer subunit